MLPPPSHPPGPLTRTAPAFAAPALLALALLAGGCSSGQIYAAGQNWQRQQCFKLNDAIERETCLRRAGEPQDALERQLEVMKNSH